MLGIGIGEMIVIAGIALVIIGPEKFPEFAKICVRTIRDLRSYVEEAKEDLRKEITPIKKEIDDVKRYDPEKYIDALTDSRDESDYYDAGYGEQSDESDTDYENDDTHAADDDASRTSEETSPKEETPAPAESTEEPTTEPFESKESQTESLSPDEEDPNIPKPMDG